jgi:hypothetical protein
VVGCRGSQRRANLLDIRALAHNARTISSSTPLGPSELRPVGVKPERR